MKPKGLIYKFRQFDIDYYLDCLFKQQLYFAKPSQLNDPFDLKISPNFQLLDTDEKWLEYADYYLSMLDRIPAGYSHLPKERIRTELANNLKSNIAQTQSDYNYISDKATDDNFGVISFSQTCTNMLLWSHYAKNHTGFAVGYNFNKFNLNNFPSVGGEVKYRSEYPALSPLVRDYKIIIPIKVLIKYIDWEYEKEYRLSRIFKNNEDVNERYLNVPIESIEEVVLAMNVTDANRDLVCEFCKTNNISVYKIYKKKNSFDLDKIRIC